MANDIAAMDDVEPPGSRKNVEEDEPPGQSGQVVPLSGAGGAMLHTSIPSKGGGTPLASHKKTQSSKTFPIGEKAARFRDHFFPGAADREWNDWHWQIRHTIGSLCELEKIVRLTDRERQALGLREGALPFAVTPYYASLLEKDDPGQPIRKAVVPVIDEKIQSAGEAEDPLHEEGDSPVCGLVHRYPDRVLFLVTDFCSTYCRYCTRSRMVGRKNKRIPTPERWQKAIDYIAATPAIRDVLISGGDPLTLPDEKLEWILSRLREIPHVEVLRIGTKAPVVLPQRITPSLVRMLKRFHPLWISIHFMHPDELTAETAEACRRLAEGGIPLQSQTVLLAGINDDGETMRKLVQGLVKIRVRPYYLYQCDPIVGSSHFRTPVEKGVEIVRALRGFTSGFAVPTYVIDAPGGGGKIPIMPEYVVGRDGDDIVLRNYEGELYRYHDGGTIGDGRYSGRSH